MSQSAPNDLDDIRQKLVELRERETRRDRLATLHHAVEIQLQAEAGKLKKLGGELAKEKDDVDRLEGLSLASIFYTLLSSKNERLEKERKELAQAKLRYDESFDACRELEEEHTRLERELAAYANLDRERKRLFQEKAETLAAMGGETAEELQTWIDSVTGGRARVREGEEAIRAGYDTLRQLANVIEALGKAQNWGAVDMLGGGLGTSLIKHSRIDSAKSFANLAQQSMRRFERELGEFMDVANIRVDMPKVSKFADIFFDGLIFDWLSQQQIKASAASAQQSESQLRRLVGRLETAVQGAREDLEKIEDGYRRYLYES